MGTRKVAARGGFIRRAGCLLAISLCLAGAPLLMAPGDALAISGYSSNTPAVAAQYPDSNELRSVGPKPVFSDLDAVIAHTRALLRNPKVRAQVRAKERVIARKTTHAIATAAGLEPPQSGSIALLVAGMGVITLGSFLRWRRGVAEE